MWIHSLNKMKKILNLILATALLSACSKSVVIDDIEQLNGYWEISEVKTPEGDSKTFESNNNADLFELNATQGTRTKVVSQIDGSIQSNGIQENFVVKDSANAIYLKYKTDFSEWTEKLERLNENELIIINQNNIKYTYKRFTPININE